MRLRIDPAPAERDIHVWRRLLARPSRRAMATADLRLSRQWGAVLTAVALLTVTATTARGDPTRRPSASRTVAIGLDAYVAEAAQRFAIPMSWIWSVMRIESAERPHAVSPRGARGLMQIMPRTWDELRSRLGLGADPFDAHDNIIAGVAYLRELRDRYGAPGFLAAYNAGPKRYEDHLAKGRPLPRETIGYVTAAIRLLNGGAFSDRQSIESAARSWTDAALFPASGGTNGAPKTGAGNPPIPARVRRKQTPTRALAPHSDGLFASADLGKVGL